MLFFITTLIFGWMALAPGSAPIKTEGTRKVAATSVEDTIKETSSRFTENLLTYKPETVDSDLKNAKKDATPEFATRQLDAFGGINLDRVASDVKANHAISSADVKATAITSRDEETATVLVVTQRAIDSDKRDPTTELLVVELTLVNTGEGWKVDDATRATTN